MFVYYRFNLWIFLECGCVPVARLVPCLRIIKVYSRRRMVITDVNNPNSYNRSSAGPILVFVIHEICCNGCINTIPATVSSPLTILTKLFSHSHHSLITVSSHSHHSLITLSPQSHHTLTTVSPQSHHSLITLSPQAHHTLTTPLTTLSPQSHHTLITSHLLRAPCSELVLRAPCSVRGTLWEIMGTHGNLWELHACFARRFLQCVFLLQGVFFTASFRCRAFFFVYFVLPRATSEPRAAFEPHPSHEPQSRRIRATSRIRAASEPRAASHESWSECGAYACVCGASCVAMRRLRRSASRCVVVRRALRRGASCVASWCVVRCIVLRHTHGCI